YTDAPPLGGSGGRIACGEIGPLRVSLQPSEMSKAPEQVASTVPSKSVFPSGLQIKTNSRSTFQRDDLKISADKMTFDGSSKIMHFQGNVIVVSRTQNIESSSADFNFQTGEIRAEGKVLIQGPKT
ncbi:MAG: hypothetical protein GIW95_03350, partial [Candidatus Eremiobacteraeota bacterium]|nr:hypothetical protein [Candidatus Eremiobacteraeota bacterium]